MRARSYVICLWHFYEIEMSERPTGSFTLKVGSRDSELALAQSYHVIAELQKLFPSMSFEVIKRTTTGDQILNSPLAQIGSKSLFTKELEIALEENEVDIVVHSSKDLPTTLPDNMVIGAILEREDPRDAVVMKKGSSYKYLSDLPKKSVIGTSSVRRTSQLKAKYPDLVLEDIRGNLNTRFRKLDNESGPYQALILAAAGCKRMGWSDRISSHLDAPDFLHAVGQGALAVECRKDDIKIQKILGHLHHRATTLSCVAERAFMRHLEGGCSVPIASHAEIDDEQDCLIVQGGVWSLDGKSRVLGSRRVSLRTLGTLPSTDEFASVVPGDSQSSVEMALAEKAGTELAVELWNSGADKLLAEIKAQ